MKACGLLLAVGIVMRFLCVFLNRFCSTALRSIRRKYSILYDCVKWRFSGQSCGGGVYGELGLLYASIFLIPMRVVMWSAGTSYFISGGTDKKKVLRNILTHPCLVAVYLGMFLMFTQIHVPEVLASSVRIIGNCNSAVTMFIIGTILADVDVRTIINKTTAGFGIFRLVFASWRRIGVKPAAGA